MRIASGKAKGITLSVPPGFDVRPTLERARQALFDSLGNISGMKVLDIFAGSGGLGLEAASRGALEVTFIEASDKHCSFISDNIEKFMKAEVDAKLDVICSNVLKPEIFMSRYSSPDLIFADPPYPQSGSIFKDLSENKEFAEWAGNALIIWELPDKTVDRGMEFLKPALWTVNKIRKFGGTDFLFASVKNK